MKPKTKPDSAATIQVNDPERRARIARVFTARGYGGLSVSAMARKVIDEWLEAQEDPAPALPPTRIN